MLVRVEYSRSEYGIIKANHMSVAVATLAVAPGIKHTAGMSNSNSDSHERFVTRVCTD